MLKNPQVTPVCILHGPVGSGKTMLAKKVGAYIEEHSPLYGINLKSIYVNCMFDRTPQSALARVIKSLSLDFPRRGYEVQEMLEFIYDSLQHLRLKIFLTLDEVSSLLLGRDDNLLYSLLRMGEIWSSSPIALLLVSKDLSFMWTLDESVRSSLRKTSIALKPYSQEQLYQIVMNRAEEGLERNALDSQAAMLIASIASDFGDARYAIELLYKSALIAEQNGVAIITPDEVHKAKKSLPPHLSSQEIAYLSEHERLILKAVARLLSKGSKAFVPTGEVEKEYRGLCLDSEVQPYAHTMLWECIQKMKAKGLLLASQSGKGFRGRTTMLGLAFQPDEVLEMVA